MIGLTMMVSLVRGSNLVDVDEVDDFFLLLLLEEFWVEVVDDDDDGVVVVVVDRRERTGRVGVVVVVVVGCTSLFACMVVQRFCCVFLVLGRRIVVSFFHDIRSLYSMNPEIESTCGSVVLFPVSSVLTVMIISSHSVRQP